VTLWTDTNQAPRMSAGADRAFDETLREGSRDAMFLLWTMPTRLPGAPDCFQTVPAKDTFTLPAPGSLHHRKTKGHGQEDGFVASHPNRRLSGTEHVAPSRPGLGEPHLDPLRLHSVTRG
jgi:hypothetical protein